MGFWSNIWKEQAKQWIFAGLDAEQVPDRLAHRPIQPGTAYVDIFLKSMRVVHVRKGISKFYGTVHSFMSLPHKSGEPANFQVLTTPSKLKELDAKNVNEAVNVNRRLLGPVPYLGGDVELELGLFSIKSADLVGPFLNLLETLATTAGVAYVTAARPFVEPLKEGIGLLAGADRDSILEIGLATTLQPVESGYFAVIRAARGDLDPKELKVREDDYQLEGKDGRPILEHPYMVFSIDSSPKRSEWFNIPELTSSHRLLRESVRSGNIDAAEEAFAVFKRTVLTSPDLLESDADALVRAQKDLLEKALQASLTSAAKADIPPLEEVDLYGSS